MKTKKILGLDLGTNSIGGAIINMPESIDDFGKYGNIEWVGSRIVPINAQYLNKWDAGQKAETKAAARRIKRGSRRLKQRYILRRTRLIQVFKLLGWLNEDFPENFKKQMNENENFKFHIGEYLPFSKETIEEATNLLGELNKRGELALSEDWIIYYLRKKALTEKISIAELCRITYMMNQRRGFKSSRKDLKETGVAEKKWVEILKIKSVELKSDEPNRNKKFTYTITPDSATVNAWVEQRFKKPEWEGKEFTFLITEKTDSKGNVTQSKPQIPSKDDWALSYVALANEMEKNNSLPGKFFFDKLVEDKKYKIRQIAVDRKKYKQELETIWNKQTEIRIKEKTESEILCDDKLEGIIFSLYKHNSAKQNELKGKGLLHIISNDIIYYQRDLKSQKNSRGECQYENHKGIDGETYGAKCAPKSSPEFQEMRIWQDIHNIKVLQKEGIETVLDKVYQKVDIDVTLNFIDDTVKEKLFELFDRKKEISEQDIFEVINRIAEVNSQLKEVILKKETHKINMFFTADKRLQGNETKEYFRKIFKKKEYNYEIEGEEILNDKNRFYKLWNISYSISLNDEIRSKQAIYKALTKKENKKNNDKKIIFEFPENIANAIASAPEIEATKKYAAYSSKAIQKLLPLMRCGKYNNEADITVKVKERAKEIHDRLEAINWDIKKIQKIADDDIQKQLLKSFITKKDNLLNGLNTYQACYLTYNRHSERTNTNKYTKISDFNIMDVLPNNSLRNPVVEQVIREALFVVKDLWEKYGQPDEIHIEMGRDLKKNASERKKASENSTANFAEKQKIKALLYELMNGFEQYENVGDDISKSKIVPVTFEVKPNPNSPNDIDRFKIWKSTSGLRDDEFDKKVREEKIPKNKEIKKYALWLSQKCVSPYTGKIIPLSKLFDQGQYEIEHVLPKARIKNDSFDNLVISERGVNKAKDKELAAIFIKSKNGGCEYEGIKYKLLNYETYVEHCKKTFRGKKLQNLLATEIPNDFISRQINDTRYITKKISELLYPVAKDIDAGIVFTIGAITSELKKEWGLQKEWKQLVKPRFERLQKINNETYILENKKDKNDIDFHIEENPDLDTKRIDHRHHAMDAIIIAATTREHIRYLNTLNAADTDQEFKKARLTLVKTKIREWALPWELFTKDAKEKLEQTVVTFKSYNKVIDKPQNRYTKWMPILDSKGEPSFADKEKKNQLFEKNEVKQTKPTNGKKWMAIRQSLFQEPQGLIYIKELVTKPFRTKKEMLDIIKLQIKRMEAQNTSAQKNTDYIYDQDTRELVKKIIQLSSGNIEAIEQYLKNFKPKNINDEPIYTVKIAVFKAYSAKRVKLDTKFDHKKIDKIPYSEKSKIPKALHEHLKNYEDFIEAKKIVEEKQKKIANNNSSLLLTDEELKTLETVMPEPFSDEGLEALDKKVGMKIRMVTIKEDVGIKIVLKNKLVQADGNPFFVMYENIETKERSGFDSLSSYDVIQQLKSGNALAEKKEGFKMILLQSNDLVYVPTKAENEKIKQGILYENAIDWTNKKNISERIYRINDFSKYDIYFKPNRFAYPIKSKELHTSYDDKCSRLIVTNKKDIEGNDITEEQIMIKDVCIKIKVDRLGNISI
jgi:CRISPR-associated endonuclease Csn1